MRKSIIYFFIITLVCTMAMTGETNAMVANAISQEGSQQEQPRVLTPRRRRNRTIRPDRPRGRGIGSAYARAGRGAGRGGARFGRNIARGKPIVAGRELGRGMGTFGKNTGKGTARVGKKIGRGARRVFGGN